MKRIPDNEDYPAVHSGNYITVEGYCIRLSAVKNPWDIINFVHRIIPEAIPPETIAV
jgi:hypothetical protein